MSRDKIYRPADRRSKRAIYSSLGKGKKKKKEKIYDYLIYRKNDGAFLILFTSKNFTTNHVDLRNTRV